jgi:nucleolar pre-ribosomal-associated protein 1
MTTHVEDRDERHADAEIYDPVFVALLFAQMLTEAPPNTALSWVELFRTNVVSLLIRCLSSRDHALRDCALDQLAHLSRCLQVIIISDF